MDKNIGRKLDGRYEITELIGVGGMADVYKANDIVDHKTVAVKILKKEFAENEEFLRRFRNESKAIAVLSHPNIVKIYDVGFSEKIQFIVMEYIDGITLKEYIETEKVLSWKDSVHFITQILRALQHAHSRGIVHRDIKPQNIMMFTDGTIKVMDFGIAKFAREQGKTATDQAIGTVHYISPEQARGDVTDAKSDVYSVGVMLYEMLTGQKPFDTDNPVTIAVMHMQSQAALPRSINPDIPVALEQIIMHAMEKDPEDRYQSAIEMMRDIESFKEDPNIVFSYQKTAVPVTAGLEIPTQFFKPVTGVQPAVTEEEDEYEYEDENEEYEYEEEEEEEEEERRSLFVPILTGVTITIIVVAVILLTGVVVSFINGGGGKTKNYEMPNLVGMEYAIADKNYAEYLDIKVIAQEYSQYEKDIIFYQSVAEGDEVVKGSVVEVKVSKGVKKVTVNDVYGWDQQSGCNILTQSGLNVRTISTTDETVEAGKIIRTEPGKGEEVDPGSSILVYVSIGKNSESFPVPNFVGMSFENANISAEVSYLEVIAEEVNSKEEAGKVIKQSVDPDTQVAEGTVITLTVSNGIPPEGQCSITFAIPTNASGVFMFKFYDSGQPLGNPTTVNTAYTNGSTAITVTGSGTKQLTAELTNTATGVSAQIGVYNVDFDKKTATPMAGADVHAAFVAVGGLVTQPPQTQPPQTQPQQTQAPQTQQQQTQPPQTQPHTEGNH